MNAPITLLNGLSPLAFLSEYWQKKPLLIRQAVPGFQGLLSPNELAGLACEEYIQSRIIQFQDNQWQVRNGPFRERDFAKLPETDWTLLVQSVNHILPEATALLQQFNFIPYARLDDLMVSYAPKGGGVGPHFDSYDVFLLQGSGKRRWKISAQKDQTLSEDCPLRILKHFDTQNEWVLEAGDMLYLPPQYAHWGIAEDNDCMTYSIGFRAPKSEELIHEFLNYLQDHTTIEGIYADPDLTPQNNPAEISAHMVEKVDKMLNALSWNPSIVGDFLGRYLTEPKMHIVFEPVKPLSLPRFIQYCKTHRLILDLQSQMLFWQKNYYLNGDRLNPPENIMPWIQILANQRSLCLALIDENARESFFAFIHPLYQAGYLHIEKDLVT